MINRLKTFFVERGGAPSARGARHSAEEFQIAAAALLVEAARMDDSFDARERDKIVDLVAMRFGLTASESAGLLEAAEDRAAHSSQLFGFTRIVKEAFGHDERAELIEMLWEVVYTDGELHEHEASLMRRLAGLLHVSDRESGAARKRVLGRLQDSGA